MYKLRIRTQIYCLLQMKFHDQEFCSTHSKKKKCHDVVYMIEPFYIKR